MSRSDSHAARGIAIVYDGDCPVCSSYVAYYRLRELDGDLQLINARSAHPLVDEIRRQKLDLDQGMVVVVNDRFFHGADAIHMLAILGSENTFFNQVNRVLFRNRRVANAIYPGLAAGRRLLLRLLGRRLIGEA